MTRVKHTCKGTKKRNCDSDKGRKEGSKESKNYPEVGFCIFSTD